MAQPSPLLLQPERNCWRIERADRAALIVDAADYYRLAREAMLAARHQILLIGWDVDTRVALVSKEDAGEAPNCLGAFLSWLGRTRPGLNIYILAWDEGLLSIPGRGTTFLRLLRWYFDKDISIKWDSTHPLDASHHQKILVIDDALAFCGGIDITASRWDTRDHRDLEPGRRRPFTHRVYEPWHDAIMAVDGNAARALGELGRMRWDAATTDDELPVPPSGSDPWPKALEPQFRHVPVAIARTRGHEGPQSELREIEALFLDLVACARRYIYFETQYFASRAVALAIAERLEEPDGPEIVVINPKTAEGWLDESVMGPARALLLGELRKRDRHGRFRIYTPVTEQGADIYVHAKIMIVDDEYLRVGSANLNNRSMGLDSECDLLIDGVHADPEARRTIASVRCDLLAEHLGVSPETMAASLDETGSVIQTIDRLRGSGRTLVPFEPPPTSAAQGALATSELLDPEAPNELFEPRVRPGLLFGLRGRQGSRMLRGNDLPRSSSS
jgi:phospholipase D1/2